MGAAVGNSVCLLRGFGASSDMTQVPMDRLPSTFFDGCRLLLATAKFHPRSFPGRAAFSEQPGFPPSSFLPQKSRTRRSAAAGDLHDQNRNRPSLRARNPCDRGQGSPVILREVENEPHTMLERCCPSAVSLTMSAVSAIHLAVSVADPSVELATMAAARSAQC